MTTDHVCDTRFADEIGALCCYQCAEISVDCVSCKTVVTRRAPLVCNCCHQIGVFKCDACADDKERALRACSGCRYAVCKKDSLSFVCKVKLAGSDEYKDCEMAFCIGRGIDNCRDALFERHDIDAYYPSAMLGQHVGGYDHIETRRKIL